MTREEAAAILSLLASAWPKQPIPPDTAKTWANSLATEPFDPTWEAAEWIVNNDQHFPTIARLRERIRHEKARHTETHALEAAPVDPIGYQRFLALARAAITEVHHDHKRGAAGCPTCSKHDHSSGSQHCPRCLELAGINP